MNGKVFFLAVCLPVAAALIGGLPAPTKNSLPWQAMIKTTQGGFCGGTIIRSQWILTAAHCVDGVWENEMTVYTGEYNLQTPDLTEQPHYVAKIYTNGYDACSKMNDIALLQLTGDIIFDTFRQPINMALPGEEYMMNIFSGCQISGWGSEVFRGDLNNFLEFLNVVPLDRQTCAAQLDVTMVNVRGTADPAPVTEQHLCVTSMAGTGGCTGDSGGPLTCQRQYVDAMTGLPTGISETVLLGATSRGSFVCGGAPTVYTSVPFFYNWIINTMNTFNLIYPPPMPGMLPPPPPLAPSPFPKVKLESLCPPPPITPMDPFPAPIGSPVPFPQPQPQPVGLPMPGPQPFNPFYVPPQPINPTPMPGPQPFNPFYVPPQPINPFNVPPQPINPFYVPPSMPMPGPQPVPVFPFYG